MQMKVRTDKKNESRTSVWDKRGWNIYQMGRTLAERVGGNDVYSQQHIETAKYTNEKTMNYRQYSYYTRYIAVSKCKFLI